MSREHDRRIFSILIKYLLVYYYYYYYHFLKKKRNNDKHVADSDLPNKTNKTTFQNMSPIPDIIDIELT